MFIPIEIQYDIMSYSEESYNKLYEKLGYFNRIRENPFGIKGIKKQTKKLCLEAINVNWMTLKYVINQTDDIINIALNRSIYALQCVNKQTHEMCKNAVKQNWRTLEFVREQTDEIVILALSQNKNAIMFVNKEITKHFNFNYIKVSHYKPMFMFEKDIYNIFVNITVYCDNDTQDEAITIKIKITGYKESEQENEENREREEHEYDTHLKVISITLETFQFHYKFEISEVFDILETPTFDYAIEENIKTIISKAYTNDIMELIYEYLITDMFYAPTI